MFRKCRPIRTKPFYNSLKSSSHFLSACRFNGTHVSGTQSSVFFRHTRRFVYYKLSSCRLHSISLKRTHNMVTSVWRLVCWLAADLSIKHCLSPSRYHCTSRSLRALLSALRCIAATALYLSKIAPERLLNMIADNSHRQQSTHIEPELL
jgi:hypothetical protein